MNDLANPSMAFFVVALGSKCPRSTVKLAPGVLLTAYRPSARRRASPPPNRFRWPRMPRPLFAVIGAAIRLAERCKASPVFHRADAMIADHGAEPHGQSEFAVPTHGLSRIDQFIGKRLMRDDLA